MFNYLCKEISKSQKCIIKQIQSNLVWGRRIIVGTHTKEFDSKERAEVPVHCGQSLAVWDWVTAILHKIKWNISKCEKLNSDMQINHESNMMMSHNEPLLKICRKVLWDNFKRNSGFWHNSWITNELQYKHQIYCAASNCMESITSHKAQVFFVASFLWYNAHCPVEVLVWNSGSSASNSAQGWHKRMWYELLIESEKWSACKCSFMKLKIHLITYTALVAPSLMLSMILALKYFLPNKCQLRTYPQLVRYKEYAITDHSVLCEFPA